MATGPTIPAARRARLAPTAVNLIHGDGASPCPPLAGRDWGVTATSLQHGPSPVSSPRSLSLHPNSPFCTPTARSALLALTQQDSEVSPNGPSTVTASRVGERNRPSLIFSWPAEII